MEQQPKANLNGWRKKEIDEIPFDPKNLAYVVYWENWISRDSDGITVLKDPVDLFDDTKFRLKTMYHGLSSSVPKRYLFQNLDAFLGAEKQVYLDKCPKCRALTGEEIEQQNREEISGLMQQLSASQLQYVLKINTNTDCWIQF